MNLATALKFETDSEILINHSTVFKYIIINLPNIKFRLLQASCQTILLRRYGQAQYF